MSKGMSQAQVRALQLAELRPLVRTRTRNGDSYGTFFLCVRPATVQTMARKGWLRPVGDDAYHISSEGRAALAQLRGEQAA
jgi:hypothetical protein